ncbi:MAG: NosD domain-containing protein, partial [Candidatus Thorarchaeota archaeon]
YSNTIQGSQIGLQTKSMNNSVTWNLFRNNSIYAVQIMIGSNYNRITQNAFELNNINIADQGLGTLFQSNMFPHAPITANGDTDFANKAVTNNWQGTGTTNDPYIIENYFINGYPGVAGIDISSTTYVFVVRNCWVNGSSKGFQIFNNAIGVVKDTRATFNTNHGYDFSGNSGFQVFNNKAANNKGSGFYFSFSYYNNITRNFAISNTNVGFYIDRSNENNITNNLATDNGYGIGVTSAEYNNLTGNIVSGNYDGILVGGTGGDDGSRNILKSNFVSLNSNYGFNIFSNNNLLINNTAKNNLKSGFFLSNNFNCILTNNSASMNGLHGFELSTSSGNTLISNIATENSLSGIMIYILSTQNLITFNYLINNFDSDALDNSYTNGAVPSNSFISKNIWISNTYSDYFGDGSDSYLIPGSANVVDESPVVLDSDLDGPPDWFELLYGLDPSIDDASLDFDHDDLTNIQEFVAGTDPTIPNFISPPVIINSLIINDTIHWYASSSDPASYIIYSNDTLVQSGVWLSNHNISYFIGDLPINTYNITIVVQDAYGRSVSLSTTITVTEDITSTEISTITTIAVITDQIFVPNNSTQVVTSYQIIPTTSTLTKTAEGFGLSLLMIFLLGMVFFRRKRQNKL